MTKKSRMTLEMPQKARQKLEALSRLIEQPIDRVIINAFVLYDLVAREMADGKTLILRNSDGNEREIVLREFE